MNLKSQIVISSWGGLRRARPYAFTEQGVAMLSSVLRSKRAISVNVEIMRALVYLRQLLASHTDLARKLDALEKRYDAQFRVVFDAIRQLMMSPEPKESRPIGFRPESLGGEEISEKVQTPPKAAQLCRPGQRAGTDTLFFAFIFLYGRSRLISPRGVMPMPPAFVRTIREEILYEYAKLIPRSACGSLQWGFITDRLRDSGMEKLLSRVRCVNGSASRDFLKIVFIVVQQRI